MPVDFKTNQLKVNQIINSGSSAGKPLLIYGLGSSTDNSGGFNAAHFATGSDTWLFISGTVGSRNSANRGAVAFGGDVIVSGALYNAAGAAYSTAISWNELSPSPSLNTTASVSIAGNLGSAFAAPDSGTGTFFFVSGTTGIAGSLAKKARFGGDVIAMGDLTVSGDLDVGGSSSASIFNFSVAHNRTGGTNINLGTGATSTGNVKVINIGQGGAAGSTTNIKIGTTETVGLTNVFVSGSTFITGSVSVKGSIVPDANTTYTLGTEALRWAHVYTGDLHLRNERGDWTVIEENDFLRIVNNKTGKNYKMMMQLIED
jgi:hypothetical protein